MLEILRLSGLSAVTLVDASLRHRIDDKESLETMIRSGQVTQTPAGRTADEFLVQLALRIREQRKSVYILTNDTFPENGRRGVCPGDRSDLRASVSATFLQTFGGEPGSKTPSK